MTLSTGTRLGPYEILSPLGAGGSSERRSSSRASTIRASPSSTHSKKSPALLPPLRGTSSHLSCRNKIWYEFDWEGSESEFRSVFALNPNYAFAHDQFGLGLAFQGRPDEAVAEGKRAAELDPLDPQIPIDNFMALAWQRKYQAAMEEIRKVKR